MKKDGKPVFGGIRNKLFLLILLTVVLIAASFFAVTTYQNNMLSELSAETSRKRTPRHSPSNAWAQPAEEPVAGEAPAEESPAEEAPDQDAFGTR